MSEFEATLSGHAAIRRAFATVACAGLLLACDEDGRELFQTLADVGDVHDEVDGGPDASEDAGRADADSGGADDPDADGVGDTSVDAGADASDPAGFHARYDPEGLGFFDTPWPSDHRVHPDGTPDLSNFPGASVGPMPTFRAAIEHVITGFSTMPAVYVAFEESLAGVGLPSAATTTSPGSVVQLVDVSEAGCGRRIPLVLSFDSDGDPYRPANVLSATPVPGFVADPLTPYAFVLRRELGQDVGKTVRRPEAFDRALAGEGNQAISDSLDPLRRCLEVDPLDADDIALATVFTTQDATTELQTVRDHVVNRDRVAAPVVRDMAIDPELSDETVTTWRGTYDTPIYQAGTPPYAAAGAFVFTNGEPEVQRWESVPFILSVPTTGDERHPVLVFLDGTGFTLRGAVSRQPASDALADGFAVASFAPQFHDTRAVDGSDPILHGFNYLNPVAGRTVFRQQVVDTAYFVRVLREALPVDEAPGDQLDTSSLVYGGHSQGGIVGAFVAGVESEFAAYVLNGTGTYLSITITRRTTPVDIPALIEELFSVGHPIDEQHPLAALVQLGTEVVEPHNYARRWKGRDGHESGAHVMVINGWNDSTTFPPSMDAMVISGDLDVVAPAGWDVDPYHVWDRPSDREPPFAGNRTALDDSPLSFAAFVDRDAGHSTIRTNDRIRASAVRFWREALEGAPTVE